MAENFFGLTDTGKVRSNNEDTFIAQRLSSQLILANVIDGVGGYNGGEVAAAIAREQMLDYLSDMQGDAIPAMIESFKLANNAISAKKQEVKELDSMACVATMALVDIQNNLFYYAHVGDTRLYLLRDTTLVKISKDHSFVGFLEDSGRLTEKEAMDHPKRNEINKALGFTSQIDADESFIETGQSPFLPGDMLLLCSDGLTDMVNKVDITDIITQKISLQEKATRLIHAANKNGGHDNITVVLVQNDKLPVNKLQTAPTVEIKKNDVPAAEVKKEHQAVKAAINPEKQKAMPAKKSNMLSVILAILCIAFLGAALYYYLQWQKEINKPVAEQTSPKNAEKQPRNAQEIQLQNAINMAKGDTVTLIDSLFKQPVIVSDTLDISKPRLFIKVKGSLALQCDTAYKGPAFSVFKGAKAIGLENIKLQGFTVGVSTHNTDLHLKNVQFINCNTPVLRAFILPLGKPVTEGFPVTVLYADSVSKSTKPANGTR
jgi:serine/threonine protein phosphatase PrpC/preprotein translocase subunit SecG